MPAATKSTSGLQRATVGYLSIGVTLILEVRIASEKSFQACAYV